MCTYTHIYIYIYIHTAFECATLEEFLNLLGNWWESREKKLSYQHLLGPIYQTLAKTVSFCVMSQKKSQTAPSNFQQNGSRESQKSDDFFLKRNTKEDFEIVALVKWFVKYICQRLRFARSQRNKDVAEVLGYWIASIWETSSKPVSLIFRDRVAVSFRISGRKKNSYLAKKFDHEFHEPEKWHPAMWC